MWRAGVTYKNGEIEADNFYSKDKAEEWVLSLAEKNEIKKSIIFNKENIKERFIENWK